MKYVFIAIGSFLGALVTIYASAIAYAYITINHYRTKPPKD